MDASGGKRQYIILLVVMIALCHQICYSYEFRCPGRSEWKFKGNATCGIVLEYFCVLDDNVKKYTEFCKTNPDITRDITWKKGEKSVLRGNLDGEVCSTERYQPFIFRTDGNSDCVYKNSICRDEGMISFKNGSKTEDTQCRCDHSKGFALVSKIKHDCFCIPSQEDCSCYKKQCKSNFKLSSNYICTSVYSQDDQSTCSGFGTGPLIEDDPRMPKLKETNKDFFPGNDINQSRTMLMASKRDAFLTVSILTGCCVVISIIISFMECTDIKDQFETKMEDKPGEMTQSRKDLVREKLTVNYKDIITKMNYKEIIDKLKLKEDQKKTIDENLGLTGKNIALFNLVLSCGIEVHEKFIKALRQSNNSDLAEKIENTKGSDNRENLEEEISNFCSRVIQENTNKYEAYIKKWLEEDSNFFVTRGTTEVEKLLKQNNCVLVVGRSGNGKSAIIRHIALKLFNEEGFDIIQIDSDPAAIFQNLYSEKKTIFVIDDFYKKMFATQWSLKINGISKLITHSQDNYTAKFLFATNPCVYEDNALQCISSLSQYTFDLSKYQLTDDEKIKMYKKYTDSKQFCDKVTKKFRSQEDLHPLLCKIAAGKTTEQIILLFESPDKVIGKDLYDLQQENKTRICLIALCVLLESIPDSVFDDVNANKRVKDVIEVIFTKFEMDIHRENDRNKILRQLQCVESPDETYLTKTGHSYHFVHTKIYDIAAVICGKIFTDIFIKWAPYSFIAERYNFKSNGMDDKKHLITIDDEDTEKKYFDRLMEDLKQRITYSTFHNSQLKHVSYRTKFCSYCKDNKDKVVLRWDEVKKGLSEQSIIQNDEITTTKEKKTHEYADYISFTKQSQFSTHEMKMPLIESVWEGYTDIVNLLLDDMNCKVNMINVTDTFGRSPLFVACQRGEKHIAECLLKKGANHALCDENNTSPLLAACKGGYIYPDIIEILLEKKADASKCDIDGCSPLHAASVANHKRIVEILLKDNNIGQNICHSDKLGRSALYLAAYNGRKAVVDLLFSNGATLDECDGKKFTPLMAACSNGKITMVKYLLQRKVDISKIDDFERSALFIACENREHRIVDILLESKADVSQCDIQGRSPLYISCSLGHENIVRSLVKYKADILQRNEDGKTPLFIACEKGNDSIVEYLVNKCNVEEVVDKCDNQGRSPLYVASKGGFVGIVNKLVFSGSDINKPNKWKMTPLLVACREGHSDVVEFLIKNDADLEIGDYNGRTPFSVACDEGNAEVVKLLKKKGSNIYHEDRNRETPYELAKRSGHKDIIEMFLKF